MLVQIKTSEDLKGKVFKEWGSMNNTLSIIFEDNSYALFNYNEDYGNLLEIDDAKSIFSLMDLKYFGIISEEEYEEMRSKEDEVNQTEYQKQEYENYLLLKLKFEGAESYRKALEEKRAEITSAMYCGHANEVPSKCDCKPNCYCKNNTCNRAKT